MEIGLFAITHVFPSLFISFFQLRYFFVSSLASSMAEPTISAVFVGNAIEKDEPSWLCETKLVVT